MWSQRGLWSFQLFSRKRRQHTTAIFPCLLPFLEQLRRGQTKGTNWEKYIKSLALHHEHTGEVEVPKPLAAKETYTTALMMLRSVLPFIAKTH